MSRVIKFRAWHGKTEQMTAPFDLNAIQGDPEDERHEGGRVLFPDGWWYLIDRLALMQLTGLKDSFEEDLFEGDIVDEYGVNRPIVFSGGAFCTIDERGEITLDSTSWVLVGNIYENPELLKETNEPGK